VGSRSQDPQCLKQQSQHFLGFTVFAFTMPAGILFASCSAAAVPAEGSGDSGFITLLDPADGNLSSIVYYPRASCGAGVGCCYPVPAPTVLGAHPCESTGSRPLAQGAGTEAPWRGHATFAGRSVQRRCALGGMQHTALPGHSYLPGARPGRSSHGYAETWMLPSPAGSWDVQGW